MEIKGVKIKEIPELVGKKHGLVDRVNGIIYVSPAVYLLLEDSTLSERLINELPIIDLKKYLYSQMLEEVHNKKEIEKQFKEFQKTTKKKQLNKTR